jgi:HEAT repeat protein
MTKREAYRARLRSLKSWDAYLLKDSGLPGPRGNIELAQAVADEGSPTLFFRFLEFDPLRAPTNSQEEFLAFCGALGLGRLLAEGRTEVLEPLRRLAADPRWRVREAVAMALQRYGEVDMPSLVAEMRRWGRDKPFLQRAAAAALCEPRLLHPARHAKATLAILDAVTASVERAKDRQSEGFQALRKGLGYAWSVAVVALPEEGLPRMERWLKSPNPDVRWIMRENLKKARLARVDPGWVRKWSQRVGSSKVERSG